MDKITFRYDVPLEDTMELEEIYYAELQSNLLEKEAIRSTPGSIFVWMFVDEHLVGESYGKPPCDDRVAASHPTLKPWEGIHCWSTTIIPRLQSRRLGTELKAHWLQIARSKGYKLVSGIARPGPSMKLNSNFGAKIVTTEPNWCGSGEEYLV
jgi:predicted GNAT superfamily acetyltransferase